MRLSAVIVLAPRSSDGESLRRIVPPDVPVYFSPAPDELGRLIDALSEYPAEALVRISCDHPLVDPVLVDRLVIEAAEQPAIDYVGYSLPDGQPAVLSTLGVFGEWVRTKALIRADRDIPSGSQRQAVTCYFHSQRDRYRLRLLPVPAELQRDDVRLAVDCFEDWENVQDIFEALGPEHVDWQRITGLLDHQPELRRRMAELNRAAV
jgi:spore coat polysaccharide biosynthesis protein SpsF